MKTTKFWAIPLLAALVWPALARAQAVYPFTFKGTCVQTNSQGKVVSQNITDKTLLQEKAQAAGITDLSSLKLVYHIHGSDFGDTVDIINSTNGAVLDTLFGFFFGETFGRQVLTDGPHKQELRLDYIYTAQNDHSLGAALVTKKTKQSAKGAQLSFSGQMDWVVTVGTNPGSNKATKVCTGKFTTGKALSFTNAPAQ